MDHRHVKAGEVHQFQPFGIGQHRLQIGRVILAGGKAHEVLIAVAVADLQQAQPVAVRVEAHGLAVHGYRAGSEDAGGQVAFVKINSHGLCVSRVKPCCHPPCGGDSPAWSGVRERFVALVPTACPAAACAESWGSSWRRNLHPLAGTAAPRMGAGQTN